MHIDITHAHIIFATGKPASFIYKFEIFDLNRPMIEPEFPRHGVNVLLLGYWSGL